MTENKRYTAQMIISTEAIERSNDMAIVHAEKSILAELYMEADMPRDFRIRFRHEPFELQQSLRVVGQLDVIDPTNPRIEDDKDWFKWMKQAPTRAEEAFTKGGYSNTTDGLLRQLYEPQIREQLERAAEFKGRDLQTFDALSGLGSIKAEIKRDLDKKLIESMKNYVPATIPVTAVQTKIGGDTEA